MGRRKPQGAITPPPRTAAEHLAAQSGTNAADWYPVTTGTQRYREGYRWWNKATDQWAKRVVTEQTPSSYEGLCPDCQNFDCSCENNT